MMPTHSLSPPLPASPPPKKKGEKRRGKKDRKNSRVFGDVVVKYGYIILAKAQVGICIKKLNKKFKQ